MKTEKNFTKISKWGNGYGIRIPIAMLEAHNLTEGSEVTLHKEQDGVKISPRTPSLADMTLVEIMGGITPEKLVTDSPDDFFGAPQGNEVW